ncbi:MAG: ATP-binding cassette domain-containing protein [Acidobacteria bacterium]|nr:ATP-binding cassette domain-containing protein [Acidobacteriota bacterium]MBI3654899.1 ATP-binding cassette domain-containing protein [Acidobacteriota bacterium]
MNPNYYIEFEDVYKSFGDKAVLRGVSFGIERGQTLAVLGRSGTGKSVVLSHIIGLLKPDSGRVFVAGEEVSALSEAALMKVRRKVSLIFQSGALFDSMTIGENIAFPLYERHLHQRTRPDDETLEAKVREILAMLELGEVAALLPAELATGGKRRVAIARALAAEPEALLYDEPTTMVDPLAARVICKLIRKLQSQFGMTSVVVTHDIAFCARRVADQVAFLNEGKVVFFGPMNEIYQVTDPLVQKFVQYDAVSFNTTMPKS